MSDTATQFRTCPLCEATCGLEVEFDRATSTITRIRGDREDVFSHGFICPKGSTLRQLHEDPDRLRLPQIRQGNEWRDASWDDAYALIAERLPALMEEHGRDSVALYFGNPSVHNFANTIYVRPLVMAVGTTNIYSASTVDQMPRHVSSGLMFGNPLAIAVPDLDRTDYLLMLGANPWESNGSLCTAPDFPGKVEAIRARGGTVVVVDPRRTRTANHADEHVPIRPGTDTHLLLAMANVVISEGLADLGPVARHTNGLDVAITAISPFTAEAVAPITGIPVATIERLARAFAAAPSAVAYGRIGTHTVEFGTLASWATDLLTTITGNLDRPGGAMWPSPAHSAQRPGSGGGRGFVMGRRTSRVKGYPEVRSEFPVATLADEILTPGEGQVRALITIGGNPARSAPHSARLEQAMSTLDFMVSIDPFRNETTRFADVILPPPSHVERSHYDLAFYGLSVRNIANYSPPLFPAKGPTEADLVAKLALIAGGQPADADPQIIHDLVVDSLLEAAMKTPGSPLAERDPKELKRMLGGHDPADRALDVMLRTGRHGDLFGANPGGLSIEKLERHPHGIDYGPLESQLPSLLRTPSAKVELAPNEIVADLTRLAASLDRSWPEIVLVGRRHVRSNNSWMHNVEVLVKGKERCTLTVHPDTAAAHGLVDGGQATVTSKVGAVCATVETDDTIMPGVVSLPHGWGHDAEGAVLQVAALRPGVNSNILTDPEVIDPLSGNAVLNGIPVELAPS